MRGGRANNEKKAGADFAAGERENMGKIFIGNLWKKRTTPVIMKKNIL